MRKASLPEQQHHDQEQEQQQRRRYHHKHHVIAGQGHREVLASAAAANARAEAAATAMSYTEGAGGPPQLKLSHDASECSSTAADEAGPSPGKGSGRLHAVITEQFTRAADLPPPIGEIERDKAKHEERAAASNGADSVASMVQTTLVLPPGIPERHVETEEEAQEEAVLLLGPLEAKIKREVSGTVNPLTGGGVTFEGGAAAGAGGAAAAALRPLPQLLRGSAKKEK